MQLSLDLPRHKAPPKPHGPRRRTAEGDVGQLRLDLLPPANPKTERRHTGTRSYLSGMAAEEQVEALYVRRGAEPVARRWRGGGGELDLVFKEGGGYLFVEVKRATRHDWALERLSQRQIGRIFSAATVFLDTCPEGPLTEARFDVATVDITGQIRIIADAFV